MANARKSTVKPAEKPIETINAVSKGPAEEAVEQAEKETTIVDSGLEQTAAEKPIEEEISENTGISFTNTKKYIVNSPKHANGKVFGSTGIIEFDKDGNAFVCAVDAEHFAKVPGYTVKEK